LPRAFVVQCSRFAIGNTKGETAVWNLWDCKGTRANTQAENEVGLSCESDRATLDPMARFTTLRVSKTLKKKSKHGKTCSMPPVLVRCTAISVDGTSVVAGCEDGSVCVWAI
jgi:WD40 repeat protein